MAFWKKQKPAETPAQQEVSEVLSETSVTPPANPPAQKQYDSMRDYFLSTLPPEPPDSEELAAARKQPARKRTHQIIFRMSDSEMAQFQKILEDSGMSQQRFLLRAVLRDGNPRKIEQVIQKNAEILEELNFALLLLRTVLKCNPARKQQSPDEWQLLVQLTQSFEKLKKQCQQILEDIHGDY